MATELATEGKDFDGRLVRLNDGRPGLRSGLAAEARAPGGSSGVSDRPVLEFVASDDTLDRHGEIIEPLGWRLDAYERNPVFQNAHQYGDVVFTLGKALATEVRSGKLRQLVEFAIEANPMARIAYSLYRGGFLNAVSVGFIPLRWENGSETTGYRRRFLEQELVEVSAVGIPANPNALQLGLKAGVISSADVAAAWGGPAAGDWELRVWLGLQELRQLLCAQRGAGGEERRSEILISI